MVKKLIKICSLLGLVEVLIQFNSYNQRKFRSQTSDNMERLKAEMGMVREKRRVEERRVEE